MIFFSLRAANAGVGSSQVIRVYCLGMCPGKGRRSGAVHVGPRVPVPTRTSTIRNVCSTSVTSYPAFGRITHGVTGSVRKYSLTNFGSGHFSVPILTRRFLHTNISVSVDHHGFISIRIVFRGVRRHALSTTCGFCYNGGLRSTRATRTSAHTACRILVSRLSHCPRLRGSITFLTSCSDFGGGISFTNHVICSSGNIRMFGFNGCGNVSMSSILGHSPNCCD